MPNNDPTYTVKEIVTRLEAKVDKVIDDHENRLRSLEKFSNKSSGAISIVLSLIAVMGTAVAIAAAFNVI